ncbi:protein OPAQUE10-like isoform X3 [Dioscorea cayenensis subsp. rotundata]|uniref:Protein OPAQUE10-like isoform X3 n=1 Tax=Dioscorea cayennensis subsp. rotundata TaxID=55577 RepID=A0AB40AHD6_DIOCR|nr:protein OPAQUE10-like isoform X3 [Dioscorea cayenensis subsp. rotundata]
MMRRMAGEVLRVRETSPDEAETSFRELDDVFLQTQTRIWLGEVLHERFDEEMAVADLLADGELLFQVSKAVWKMILNKNVDIRHSKFFIYERTSFGKADGRYMAYPKVDSFLKVKLPRCQI